MAGKISKSDTTPEMEADAEAWRQKMLAKKCQHFAVGTWIMQNNRRGQILRYTTRRDNSGVVLLRIRWEDGSMSAIEPHALNRSSND